MLKDVIFLTTNILLLAIPTTVIIHAIRSKSKSNNNPPEK